MAYALMSKAEYTLHPIEKEGWRELDAAGSAEIAFVDGGNSLIIQTPTAELHKIRAAAVVMKGEKMARLNQKEGLLLVKAKVDDGKITYEASFLEPSLGGKETMKLPEVANSEKPLGKAAEICRKLCELSIAKEALGELSGDAKFVVLDGTLETFGEQERTELRSLEETAAANNVLLGSVAKTCSLLADNGDSLISAAGKISNGKEGFIVVAEGRSERHRASIAVARLNKWAQHTFRVEVANNSSLLQLAEALVQQSNDLAFPGYPYGLVMADRMARVGNSETELLQAKTRATATGEMKAMLQSQKAMNAHSILDRI